MAINLKFDTVSELIAFLDSFDGYGMVVTDGSLQADRIREWFWCYKKDGIFDANGGTHYLIDDYENDEDFADD